MQRDGDLSLSFTAIGPDGAATVFAIVGDAANDDNVKREVGDRVRAAVARGECVATILVSDTFYAEGDAETMRNATAIRRALGLTIEQGARAGLYPLREAIVVSLESPLGTWNLRQMYRRDGRSIELQGAPVELEGGAGPGRLSGFFAPAKTARAS